jgi:hypothetical protein
MKPKVRHGSWVWRTPKNETAVYQWNQFQWRSISLSDYLIFRCSSRSSVSEEYLMGPSVSVCHVFPTGGRQRAWPGVIVAQQWEPLIRTVGTHCCATVGRDVIVGQQWPRIALVQQWPRWCNVKNTFGMSAYGKEHTFPSLFVSGAHTP